MKPSEEMLFEYRFIQLFCPTRNNGQKNKRIKKSTLILKRLIKESFMFDKIFILKLSKIIIFFITSKQKHYYQGKIIFIHLLILN